ncbi:hypothetical protein SAMN05443245_5204 [Paraburkholderia fungorum]|uniref:Uncharacterized protein n=1 Tax=Paraburkholderia fungorum TaxID=134537 RepID=A0A1H1IHV7_9BURK|nr:hypothetical protein [Paraburkholderia fungorum]SDR37272.1 hypothetical protein SAMN05443245_5204 [Paraburkholderia fungorum]
MQTEICKITFLDGSWLKAELPTGGDMIGYVLDNFGMFSAVEALEADDAAVVAAQAKKIDRVKAAILKHTGRTLPASAVRVTQYAFRIEAFDHEGICVFADRIYGQDDELYRLGVDRFGLMLVASH